MVIKALKIGLGVFTIISSTLISGLLTVILFSRITDNEAVEVTTNSRPATEEMNDSKKEVTVNRPESIVPSPESVVLDAPMIMQNPELPSGCEITSLTMLFQFYGINKTKMDLVEEMPTDKTKIVWGKNGTILYWGNPHIGFVGDITAKSKAFSIYHTALFPLLKT